MANMIDSETQVKNAFLRCNYLVSVFFDIHKACDKTLRYGILHGDLFDLNFRENIPSFLLKNVYLTVTDESSIRNHSFRLLQGG